MPSLFPHQITGATFLAARNAALLADEQRVGKTAAAIAACDLVLAQHVLVITTATARAQWAREFGVWGGWPRRTQVLYGADRPRPDVDVTVVGWSTIYDHAAQLTGQWDAVLLDESHYAKNPETGRTQAVYPRLTGSAENVWCLSGTPAANSPADLWPMLNALAPERIDNISYEAFIKRYCVYSYRPINGRMVRVIKGGKNLDDLKPRLDGFVLRRTQQDVGIQKPIYSVLALSVDKLPPELRGDVEAQAVLDAVEQYTDGEVIVLESLERPLWLRRDDSAEEADS